MKIERYQAQNYSSGRDGREVDRIVIHHWGTKNAHINAIIGWFCKWNSRSTSAHYVVGNGRVAQIVSESDTAWHAGDWNWNCRSIGIECKTEKSNEDLHLVAKLVADIWKRHGKLPIYEHRDIVSTACCGKWRKSEVKKLAEQYYSGKKKATSNKPTIYASGKKYRLKRDTSLWDVAGGTWDSVKSVKKFKKGDVLEIADFFISKFGAKYGRTPYSQGKNLLTGFNVVDLELIEDVKPKPTKKSVNVIAHEVIQGKWGNGSTRKEKLTNAGYNYSEVQDRVNELLS